MDRRLLLARLAMANESATTASAKDLELPSRAAAIESLGSFVKAVRDVRDKAPFGQVLANLTACARALSQKQTAKEWVRSANTPLTHVHTLLLI